MLHDGEAGWPTTVRVPWHQGIEERLQALGVRYLVLPSLRRLLPMWVERFACQPLTLAEAQALESRIVFPDTASAQLLKKALQAAGCGVFRRHCTLAQLEMS